MYNHLKLIVKNILPKTVLFNHEEQFRKLLRPLYKGNNCKCSICETKLKEFVQLGNNPFICPICGSIPRTRRLYLLLTEEFIKPNISFLDFSPSRSLYRKWKKRKDIAYFPTDFENEFLSDYHYDITNINAKDETFDLIVCYHILEHISDDARAMNELFRVLKKGGAILIQTPFKEGEIYENPNINSPAERLKHFGQDDHVRIYSVSGLLNRLERAGFKTEVRMFNEDKYQGLRNNERVIICRK